MKSMNMKAFLIQKLLSIAIVELNLKYGEFGLMMKLIFDDSTRTTR